MDPKSTKYRIITKIRAGRQVVAIYLNYRNNFDLTDAYMLSFHFKITSGFLLTRIMIICILAIWMMKIFIISLLIFIDYLKIINFDYFNHLCYDTDIVRN